MIHLIQLDTFPGWEDALKTGTIIPAVSPGCRPILCTKLPEIKILGS